VIEFDVHDRGEAVVELNQKSGSNKIRKEGFKLTCLLLLVKTINNHRAGICVLFF
jgi:hypothetical protein